MDKTIKKIIITLISLLFFCNTIFAESQNGITNDASAIISKIMTMKEVSLLDESATIETFDTINFGGMESSKDAYGIYNKEEIPWILIKRYDNYALLMSKYIIECKPYNTEKPVNLPGDISKTTNDLASNWEQSTLRKWLNNDFYNKIFSESEKKLINNAILDNTYLYDGSHNEFKGNTTRDNIFILNENELFYYFGRSKGGEKYPNKGTVATDYVKNNTSFSTYYNGYLLRSYGMADEYIYGIKGDGSIKSKIAIDDNHFGIRPCIFIKLKETSNLAKIDLNEEIIKENDLINNGLPLDAYEKISIGKSIDDTNNKLSWYVIKKEDNKMLILSEYALPRKKYYDKNIKPHNWNNSLAKEYLNNDFYNLSFNDSEKDRIIYTNNQNSSNPKYTVEPSSYSNEKVFLLSYDEVVNYIGLENKNLLIAKTINGETSCLWPLRTAGKKDNMVMYIKSNGEVSIDGKNACQSMNFRPAMWVRY